MNKNFRFNHTMLRVKDAKVSLDFYTRILGMRLLRESHYPEGKFSLYFLAYVDEKQDLPSDESALKVWIAEQAGVLELTHNWGTESDEHFAYHHGNSEPRGFGHICVSVPDLKAAVEHFDREGVVFQKRLEQGSMRDIAFIKDPDGYWIEIISYRE
ncbi:MAG: lactoylglutathione lyase [Cardiobacteriaceae bacterium]|nr:lactoylglutathione lyase [Cardiobacteriaceae bacterium]